MKLTTKKAIAVSTIIGPEAAAKYLAAKIPMIVEATPMITEVTWKLLILPATFLAVTAGIITIAPVRSVPKNFTPSATTQETKIR